MTLIYTLVSSGHGLGYDVVMRLSRRYHYQFRHLYFDNFFSSVNLLEDLLAKDVYACATIRKNRAQLPQMIKTPGRLQRGQGVMSQKGNIVCVVWHDKRDVRVISSNSQPRFTTVPRRVKGSNGPWIYQILTNLSKMIFWVILI